jgi:YD repeat-containing protein
MDIANVKVEVIQPGNDSGVPEPLFDYDRIVFTLPDGSKHGFTFQPKRVNPDSFINDGQYWPHFEPDPGVSSTLQMSGRHPALLQAAGAYLDTAMVSHQEYNPASGLYGDYELTLRNGTKLYVAPRTGELRQLVDRTGNSLTFTAGGIFHSAGRSVQFVRDHAERITEIILPDDTPTDPADNPRISYTYDGNGDLRAVEDRSGAVTGLFYVSPQDPGYRPHYLERIDDPLGRTAARTEYDADGRLAKVTDADGKTIEFAYDAENKTQTMTDQLGYRTVQHLDARGNVIYEENVATGGITLREYDQRDNLLWETIVIGQIDSPGNGETDDLTTWYTYYPGTSDRWTTTDPAATSPETRTTSTASR